MKLKSQKKGESFESFFEQLKKDVVDAKKVIGNLTHRLEFFHYGVRCDFYLDGELFVTCSGAIIIHPELFKLENDYSFWGKLLKYSKREN